MSVLLLFAAAASAVTDDVFVWLKWDGVIRYSDQSAIPSNVQLGIGYRIYQSTDGETWDLIADIPPNGIMILDSQWRGDVTVDFDSENKVRVTAYLGEEETDPSNDIVIPLPSLESPQNGDIPITIYIQG